MNPRHAAALALVDWYLLEPPFTKLPNGTFDANLDAPLGLWFQFASFDTAAQCEAVRAGRVAAGKQAATNHGDPVVAAIAPYAECVATDDPRLKETGRDRADPKALVRAIGDLKRRVTLVFDALDEAQPGHPDAIGKMLIKPLAALPQVQVLVGTRRSPNGSTIPEGEPRHARLKKLFGSDALILDLEDEPETADDIAQYARLRLRDSRHKNARVRESGQSPYPEITRFAVTACWMMQSDANPSLSTVNRLTP